MALLPGGRSVNLSGERRAGLDVVIIDPDFADEGVGEIHALPVRREAGAVGAADAGEDDTHGAVRIDTDYRRFRRPAALVHAAGDEATLPVGAAVIQSR